MTDKTAAQADNAYANSGRLADIIFQRSFGYGKVVLASGKESNFYFDMKPTMLDPEGAYLIAHQLYDAIKDVDADYVGGLEMGAVPITGGVCQISFEKGRPIRGFFVRKQVKDHGAQKLVEGLTKSENLSGKKLIIVEDVTTTGESAFKAIEACRKAGAEVVLVVSLVDRQDGAEEFFKSKSIPFNSLYQASDFLKR